MATEGTAAPATEYRAPENVFADNALAAGDSSQDTVEAVEGITPPTEAELRGMTDDSENEDGASDTGDQESTEETSSGSKTASPESKEEKVAEAETSEEEKAEAKEPEVKEETKAEDVPPKGYVPLQAVREVRTKNQSLEAENTQLKEAIASLEARVKTAPQQQQTAEVTLPAALKDFEVLDGEAFSALRDSDPEAALDYMYNLDLYRSYEGQKREQEVRQREEQFIQEQLYQQDQQILSSTDDRISKAFPGLIGEEGEISADFVQFAEEVGLTPEMFSTFHPSTVILPPGADEPILLGETSAALFEMLAGVKTKLGERGSYKDTIRAEIRKEVEAELLEKFKTDGAKAFVSVADLQGTGGAENLGGSPYEEGAILSEADMAKLTDAQLEKYLSGQ